MPCFVRRCEGCRRRGQKELNVDALFKIKNKTTYSTEMKGNIPGLPFTQLYIDDNQRRLIEQKETKYRYK